MDCLGHRCNSGCGFRCERFGAAGVWKHLRDGNGCIGAGVANAKITIADPAKGTSFELTTDAAGNYRKGQLIPDTYKVTIEAAGFQKVISNDIVVEVDAQARFDAALKVGDVTTEVEVTAAAPLLQTASGDVAQTFTSKEGHRVTEHRAKHTIDGTAGTGISENGLAARFGREPAAIACRWWLNGQLFSAMGYELDGTTNQDPILGIIVINPTMDSTFRRSSKRCRTLTRSFRTWAAVLPRIQRNPARTSSMATLSNTFSSTRPGLRASPANPFSGLPAADLPPEPVRRFD